MNLLAKPRYKMVGEMERFDERENVQSRNTLETGSENYKEFYQRHPEWEEKDRATRELSKKRVGHPLDLPFFLQQIGNLARMGAEQIVDGSVSPQRLELSAERATEKIRGFAHFLGADLVRMGPLNPAHVYTHVGKTWNDPGRKYGRPINLSHRNAISIAVGIDPNLIKTGPVLPYDKCGHACLHQSGHNFYNACWLHPCSWLSCASTHHLELSGSLCSFGD